MSLEFEGQVFSACLQRAPLRLILEKLEREKGIWFKEVDSLLDEEITIQFTALSLEDGVKRILSSMNYSLVFNRDGELNGVVILGKGLPGVATSEGRDVRAENSVSSAPPKDRGSAVGSFETVRDGQPPGGPVLIADKDLESFQVVRSVPQPGGPVEVTAEELEKFTVIRNCPSPGGPVEVSAEELEYFKIIKNCPPPGS